MTVVIVGGTREARLLATALVADGFDVVTTLAGATKDPAALPGRVRVGGFGGDAAMAAWLAETRATAVVDATHPFAARMTPRVATFAERWPVLRLQRPGWSARPDSAGWAWAGSHREAAELAADARATVLLSVGRQELAPYAALGEAAVARVITPPAEPVPVPVLAARGPFDADSERRTFEAYGIRTLVTKDSGGPAAKLDIAAERGAQVIMVRRPPLPAGLESVADVAAARAWVGRVTAGSSRARPRR